VTSADDAWIPLAGLSGWIAGHHALTEEQIAAVLGWLKARAPSGFRLGPPIPPAWRPGPMMAAAGKYLDLQWAAGAAIVRIRRPQPGSALAQLRTRHADLGYTGPLPEGLAAVASPLGVRPPNVDALLALDGQWVVVELPVSLIEQAIAAATPMAPAPPAEAPAVPDPPGAPLPAPSILRDGWPGRPAQPAELSEPMPSKPDAGIVPPNDDPAPPRQPRPDAGELERRKNSQARFTSEQREAIFEAFMASHKGGRDRLFNAWQREIYATGSGPWLNRENFLRSGSKRKIPVRNKRNTG
jgi:hypothetical protein